MLTPRQRELLTYIEGYQKRTGGVSPSFKEMVAHFGLVSNSGVHRMLVCLEQCGFVRRLRGKARAIEVLKPAPEIVEAAP